MRSGLVCADFLTVKSEFFLQKSPLAQMYGSLRD